MKLFLSMLILSTVSLVMSCSTAKKEFPADAFVVSGKMNPVSGSKALKTDNCWVLEVGTDLRQLKYYQIVGDKDMVERLHEEDMKVTIRVVNRPEVTTSCKIGSVVEVLEIIEARSQTN